MYQSAGLEIGVVLLTVAALCGVNGTFIIKEPGRQTNIYGDDFLVVIPLNKSEPETGSLLLIACMFCGGSLETSGNIKLLQTDFMVNFTAAPIASVPLDNFSPFWANKTVANLAISSDLNITVTVILKISETLNSYTAIPSQSLDKNYPVASYALLTDLSELITVASRNDTDITFKQPDEKVRHTTFANRGGWDIFQTNGSFIGAELMGDQPIIGVVGTRCTSSYLFCPRSLEQLYPLVSFGTKYVALPIKEVVNVFRAVAIWNNTTLKWSSGQCPENCNGGATLNKNESKDIWFKVGDTGIIEGSKPFILLHHTQLGTPTKDTAVVTIPPMEQFTHKTFTFSTYQADGVKTYISIMAPCKDIANIITDVPSAGETEPRQTTNDEQVFSASELCGRVEGINPGTHTIGPRRLSPNAKYSAILYGITNLGVFAHILASELYQVTCSVEPSQEVNLCPEFIPVEPIQMTTTTPQGQTTVTPTKRNPTVTEDNFTPTKVTPAPSSSNGTVIAVVAAVGSFIFGLVIIGLFMFRYFRGRRWSRLDESEYSEENPLRMHHMVNASSTC